MKRIAMLIVLILFPIIANSQKVVIMEREQGVYKISCNVNGVKMKMIFDTGASAVSLSKFMANYLYENDYLTEEDIIGTAKTQTADGTITNNVVINLRDIEISGLHIENIKATVSDSQNAPLLLGQSAIEKLGSITIDGNRLIINNMNDFLSDEEIERLDEEIDSYYKNGGYHAALEALNKIETSVGLSSMGYMKLFLCYYAMKDFNKSIDTCLRWLNDNNAEKTEFYKSFIYHSLGSCYSDIKDYSESIKYYEKALLYDQDDKSSISHDYFGLGIAYLEMSDYKKSIYYLEHVISIQFDFYNISYRDLLNESVRDLLKESVDGELLQLVFLYLGYAYDYSGDKYNAIDNMVISAFLGSKSAKEYCMDARVDYYERAKTILNR